MDGQRKNIADSVGETLARGMNQPQTPQLPDCTTSEYLGDMTFFTAVLRRGRALRRLRGVEQ